MGQQLDSFVMLKLNTDVLPWLLLLDTASTRTSISLGHKPLLETCLHHLSSALKHNGMLSLLQQSGRSSPLSPLSNYGMSVEEVQLFLITWLVANLVNTHRLITSETKYTLSLTCTIL